MPSADNTIIVHDTQYALSRSYKNGAQAFRNGTPWDHNPHRADSQAYFDWESGHVNDSAGEHFRFGLDVLAERRTGRCFDMDPAVPRLNGADPDDDWVNEQRKKFGLRN